MTSSQSSSTSSNSSWFELGDWDQPWNVVDTLGLQILPQKSKLEKSIMSKFSFDKHNEFSDVQLFTLQNSGRFFNLLDLLKFPRQPLQSSIFCCFYTKSYRCKPQRFLQRRICVDCCYWDPSKCFLEDSHSGKLEDLMSETFHSSYNPEFRNHFSAETKTHQIVYESKYSPPNLTIFFEELGISSKLQYKDGFAVNLDYLSDQNRKKGESVIYI